MGMDVYGKKPKNESGEYFRNSVWSWRPLADYCCEIAPEVTADCQNWHSNDGDGLDEAASLVLAAILRSELALGLTKAYEVLYKETIDAMPDEICHICEGTGARRNPPEIGPGDYPCNGCVVGGKPTGKRRPWAALYPFSVKNVEEFATFLENCGGFEIC